MCSFAEEVAGEAEEIGVIRPKDRLTMTRRLETKLHS